MTSFLVPKATELLARDLAADDSHAMRPDPHFHAARIGRRHLEEFIELGTPISPDVPDIKIGNAADVRAHIMAIASHHDTIGFYIRDTKVVILANLTTATMAVHNGLLSTDEITGMGNIDGGSVFPLYNQANPLRRMLGKVILDAELGNDIDTQKLLLSYKMAQESLDYDSIKKARQDIVDAIQDASKGRVVMVMQDGLSALSQVAPQAVMEIIAFHETLPDIKAAQIAKAAPLMDRVLEDYARTFLGDSASHKEAGHLLRAMNVRKKECELSLTRVSGVDRDIAKQEAAEMRKDTAALTELVAAAAKSKTDGATMRDAVLRAERDGLETAALLKTFDQCVENFSALNETIKSSVAQACRKYGLAQVEVGKDRYQETMQKNTGQAPVFKDMKNA